MKFLRAFVIAGFALILAAGCKEKKNLVTAKGNAADFGRARCICEKQKKKQPPGDLTRCTDDMARSTRYLKINFEFNSFSDDEKTQINKTSDATFTKCMAEP